MRKLITGVVTFLSFVILIIATDGGENSSKTYNYSEIVRMISEQRERHGWKIVYLSENIDTFNQGDRLGLGRGSDFRKGTFNTNVGDRQLGQCLQTECYNSELKNLRQGFATDFSKLSRGGTRTSP